LAQTFFLAAGLAALSYTCYTYAALYAYQELEALRFERTRAHWPNAIVSAHATGLVAGRALTIAGTGSLIGKIVIPRLGISAIVREGVDGHTLSLAAGHFPSTALPGQPGNVAVSAHRDTLFRGLKDVQPSDEITVETLDREYAYRVVSFSVVDPSEVSVLAPTLDNTLTLVTCYPFYFVGHAPNRFVVRAVQVAPGNGQPMIPETENSAAAVVESDTPEQVFPVAIHFTLGIDGAHHVR
jgi:LPXTG-site transpeptidase (sortase) family protein